MLNHSHLEVPFLCIICVSLIIPLVSDRSYESCAALETGKEVLYHREDMVKKKQLTMISCRDMHALL